MKKSSYFIIFSITAILFFGCKHKQVTCGSPYYHMPSYVVFLGFDTTELTTVFVDKYGKNTNFADYQSTDTFKPAPFMLSGDTIVNNFGQILHQFDYRVRVPGANRTFEITEIDPGPDSYTYTTWDFCSGGQGSRPKWIDGAKVNGDSAIMVVRRYPYLSIVLRK